MNTPTGSTSSKLFPSESSDDEYESISRHIWKLGSDLEVVYHLAFLARGHGNSLWNSSSCLAESLAVCRDKLLPANFPWPPQRTFEFGAGAALPSLVLFRERAGCVLITDGANNDVDTFAALHRSVEENGRRWNIPTNKQHIRILSHTWGDDIEDVQVKHDCRQNVSMLIASDCIYNPHSHKALLQSARNFIDEMEGLFLVGYSFHANVPDDDVLNFFTVATTCYDFKIIKELQHDYQGQEGIGGTDPKRGVVYIKVLAQKSAVFVE